MTGRWLALVFVGLMACGGDSSSDGGGDDDDDGSEVCNTVWECNNGVCECDDGTACDDADDCDVVCEVCS